MIRPAREEDLEQAAALVNLLDPTAIVSAGSLRHRVPDAFVAEVDGEVVGWAPSAKGWFFVGVHPDHRRKGLGGELFERVAERRCGERASAITLDADGAHFLDRRGFEFQATLRIAVLDLATATLPPLPPSECRVVLLEEVRGRASELYDLYMDTLRGIRSAEGFLEQTLDEWRARTLDNPDLDGRISTVVLDGDRPVALAWLLSNREPLEPGPPSPSGSPPSPSPEQGGRRAVSDYTATAHSHRGRGLATLAKIASTQAAQAAGLESITTDNDVENAPMVAINAKLGFRPGPELVQLVRVL